MNAAGTVCDGVEEVTRESSVIAMVTPLSTLSLARGYAVWVALTQSPLHFSSIPAGCIDEWLGRNRSCPLCKTSIDIDVDAMLAQQLEKEEQAAAKKSAAAAAAAASGSGTPAVGSGAPGAASSGSGAEAAAQRGGFMSRLRRNSNPSNTT